MKKILLASLLLSLSSGSFGYFLANYQHTIKSKQPYVELDTEERINSGDTLYVVAAQNDTLFLYGK